MQRHLLRPEMLLDRDRVVRAALDRGVVADDHTLAAGDAADAGQDAGPGRLVVVQAGGGERAELQERAAGVEQQIDAVAGEQLAAVDVSFPCGLGTSACGHREAIAQLVRERGVVGDVAFERLRRGVGGGAEQLVHATRSLS